MIKLVHLYKKKKQQNYVCWRKNMDLSVPDEEGSKTNGGFTGALKLES
jgi:hypothetical protein